jgi:APA family basic amino acid/polyamine antiporter
MFLVARTAQVSWLAVIFSLYVSYFIPLTALSSKLLGIGMILLFAAINYRGVSMGATVQKTFTSAKLIGLLIIIGSALLYRGNHTVAPPAAAVPFSLGHFGVALIACLLAYDGWMQVTYVAGEIKNPSRNILLALTGGVGTCIVVYLLANLAYLHVLSIPEIAASDHVGATAAERTLGPGGGGLVAAVILLSIIGTMNGCFLTSPRVFFAQARDGLFFAKFAEVHPRFRTPSFAIVAQAGWSIVLLLSGTYETLIDYAMVALWVFYALMVLGVILLRRNRPGLARPYKMWGYPVTPVFFVAVATYFIVNTAITRPAPSLASLGLIATGVPVYFLWRRRDRQR